MQSNLLDFYEPLWNSIKKIHYLSLSDLSLTHDVLYEIKKRLFLHYSNEVLCEALESGKWMYDLEWPERRLVFNPEHHLYHYQILQVPKEEDLVWFEIPKTDLLRVEVNQLFYNTGQHKRNTITYVTKQAVRSDYAKLCYIALFTNLLIFFWMFDTFRDSGYVFIEVMRYISYFCFHVFLMPLHFVTLGTLRITDPVL